MMRTTPHPPFARSTLVSAALLPLLLLVPATLRAADTEPFDAESAFAQLKELAGTWTGSSGGMRMEVTSAGHTIEQTVFPGGPHEMKTLFFLDQGSLIGQHYCALGNQPRLRFEPSDEAGLIRLVLDGGTNLDPERDYHVRAGLFRLLPGDRLESTWTFFDNGELEQVQTFELERAANE
jgi:hypothetical protein